MLLACVLHGLAQSGGSLTYANPLDPPLVLAGTFGELRSGHFHAGLDIKTQGREGLPVYAIAEGTVTRIKISLGGYGKALYVAHPDGRTSVYAHLSRFGDDIERYVKNEQYSKKSYEIQLFPEFGALTVSRGEVIAYSGNTGGSSGPHLHFEVRHSVTEFPLNPLEFGFPVKDGYPPEVQSVFVYPLGQGSSANGRADRSQVNVYNEAGYLFTTDTVRAIGRIGLGFVGFDRQDLAANKNGIYSIILEADGKPLTRQNFDQFSFAESAQINTLIDYEYYERYKRMIHKCFRDEGNRLSTFASEEGDGSILIREGERRNIRLLLADHHGNRTQVLIPVIGERAAAVGDSSGKAPNYAGTWISRDKPSQFEWESGGVFFPKGTFYEDVYLDVQWSGNVLQVHEDLIPAAKPFHLNLRIPDSLVHLRSRLYIGRRSSRGGWNHVSSYLNGNTLSAKTKILGAYRILADTVPPEIRPLNFEDGARLRNFSYLRVRIDDEDSGIDTYNAWVNGQWILMEYESKKKLLTYNFDDGKIGKGTAEIKIVVTDHAGNETTHRATVTVQ